MNGPAGRVRAAKAAAVGNHRPDAWGLNNAEEMGKARVLALNASVATVVSELCQVADNVATARGISLAAVRSAGMLTPSGKIVIRFE
ncbi:MAG: hypothetical protein NVSMB19_18540 [Vulcanimicrobiaceae bacterium]